MSDKPTSDNPPPGRPLFLDPERVASAKYVGAPEAEHDKPPDFTAYDEHEEEMPELNRALKPRHREAARLCAIGKTNNYICEKLGYSAGRISVLLSSPVMRREVDRYRNLIYDRDVISAIKELGHDSIRAIEEVIRDPKAPAKLKTENARWVLEKVTGKAKQEHTHESNTLAAFTEVLRQMQQSGESLTQTAPIDVTPALSGVLTGSEEAAAVTQHEEADFSQWLDREL